MGAVNSVGNSLTGVSGTGAFVGNSLPQINNTISGYSTTATAAGNTTLTATSNYQQFFTGTTTQSVIMPVTSTITVGQSWLIVNNSTGIVTVKSSGSNNIIAIPPGTNSVVTCIAQAGTTAADWNAEGVSGVAGVDSITGTANQVIASASTGAVVLSLPQSIATTSDVTFGSVAFNPTTKGIVGTATNNNASAGYVGEIISATLFSGSKITLSTGAPSNITSISLTAGDWDVSWQLLFETEATTSYTVIRGGLNTASPTLGASAINQSQFTDQVPASVLGITTLIRNGATCRISLASTTTIYLNAQSTFTIANMFSYGWILARRAR